jgi:excisionase family DNA binding protein
MIREGRLPAIRIGKRLRIPLAEIEAYETANRIISPTRATP